MARTSCASDPGWFGSLTELPAAQAGRSVLPPEIAASRETMTINY